MGNGVCERESRGVGYCRSLVEEQFVTLGKEGVREEKESTSFSLGGVWKSSLFTLGTGLCVCERETKRWLFSGSHGGVVCLL